MSTLYLRLRDIDAARITEGLWQGGLEAYEDREIAISGIDHAIFLAPDTGVSIASPNATCFALEDAASDLQYLDELHEVACQAAREIRDGARIATFCRQGRNRSGLMSGLILHELGWSGSKIVKRIKSRRRDALSTPAFAKYLKSLP